MTGDGMDPLSASSGLAPLKPPTTPKPARESSSTWRLTDRIGLAFAWFIGLLFCAICAALVIYLAVQGFRFLRPYMLWTNPNPLGGTSEARSGGLAAPMLGTLLVVAVAMCLAVPIGTGIAVWLTEYGRPKLLARVTESVVEMLAGAPSIVLALFGVILFRSKVLAFLSATYSGHVYGKSFFAAGAMLALLALPLVVANTREGLTAIPNHVREASYALGKTKIATIRRVLLPAARPSLVTGSILGAAHAIGDTTIIVFLLGDQPKLEPAGSIFGLNGLQGTGTTLTSFIFDHAPTGESSEPQLAYAAAVLLMLIVVILNFGADVFARRSRNLRWT